jgi:hypothetical protein
MPSQPVGQLPVTGGQQPGGSLTQPSAPTTAAPGGVVPPLAPPTNIPTTGETPNSVAVDSQAGLPVTSVVPAAPATTNWTSPVIPNRPSAPVAPVAHDASDWTTTVDTTAGTVLHDLAHAAHELRVSAPSRPLHVPTPTPSFPLPSLPISGSSLAGITSGGPSVDGSGGVAGMAAILVMFLFALAVTQRSLLARARPFPTSLAHPVPTSPA